MQGENQVCQRPGKNPRKFGIILYNYIRRMQYIDSSSKAVGEKEGLYVSNSGVEKLMGDLIQAYNDVKSLKSDLDFPVREYLLALILSGKGSLPKEDSVLKFIETIKP